MSSKQTQSLFSYNLTRPYPYRWFTPVALLTLLVFAVLFSLLNYISAGFVLVVEQTSNPNATITSSQWVSRWPSFFTSKTQPTCSTVDIPIGSQFFTNQTALTYKLAAVALPLEPSSSLVNGTAPSLTYFNNPIENCVVSSIEMDFAAMDRTSNQFAYAEWGIVVRSYIVCAIQSHKGTTTFNLTQEYDYVPPTVTFAQVGDFLGTNFLSRDAKTRASLYWGESLLSMYWAYTSRTMQDIRANQTASGNAGIRKGTMYFTPSGNTTDITSLDFFDVDFRFVVDRGLGDFDVIFPGLYGWTSQISILDRKHSYPNIWIMSDSLAKAAYSTILTDLGQNQQPNALLDENLLAHYTANFSMALRHVANAIPGPITSPYMSTASGPLGTTPSVLVLNYLCQVPVRKSAGNVIVSILIGDIVLLRSVWQILVLLISLSFLRRRHGAYYCKGCAATTPVSSLRSHQPVPDHAMSAHREDDSTEMNDFHETVEHALHGQRRPERSTSEQRLLL